MIAWFSGVRKSTELCVGLRFMRRECYCDGELPTCNCDFGTSGNLNFVTSGTTSMDSLDMSTMASGATMTTEDGDEDKSTRAATGGMTISPSISPPQTETGTPTPNHMPHPTTATGTQLDDFRSNQNQSTDEQLPIPIIVGAIVGCIALLCLIAAIAYVVSRRSRDSTPTAVESKSTSSPSSSSVLTVTTTPMTYSQVPSGTSEYGAAPVFPPSGEYGIAPPAQPYDAPPSQMFAEYESVRDPLQL
jgi:hypothetical protein